MSQKRKFEEYHDPDYHHIQSNVSQPAKKTCVTSVNGQLSDQISTTGSTTAINKINAIITREFDAELQAKEKEIDEIDRRITRGRQLLARVRYAVVHSYYTKKNLTYPVEEQCVINEQLQNDSGLSANSLNGESIATKDDPIKLQPAIHPSLKKILGKRPLDYNEILKVRPIRRAAQNATEKFQEMKKPTGTINLKIQNRTIPADSSSDIDSGSPSSLEQMNRPKYSSPNQLSRDIPQLNSARGKNQSKHVLVVGNTSKYIGDEERDSVTKVTHKWLIYLIMKTSTPIEQILSKVRFFLHESYKPNDVVEVSSPPFQLSRRGWGEFPVRIMLYFHPHIQEKPMQLFHNLVLDKKHTGLQTVGGETVAELWLNLMDDSIKSTMDVKTEIKKENGGTVGSFSTLAAIRGIQMDAELPTNLLASPGGPQSLTKESSIDENAVTSENTSNTLDSIKTSQQISTTLSEPTKATSSIVATPTTIASNNPLVSSSSSLSHSPGIRKFVKCVDKNGKISLIQVMVDPHNPKILRMVGGVSSPNIKSNQPVGGSPSNVMITPSSTGNNKLNILSVSQQHTSKTSTTGNIQRIIQIPKLNTAKICAVPQNLSTIISVPKQSSSAPGSLRTSPTQITKPVQSQQSLLKSPISLLKTASNQMKKPSLQMSVDKKNVKVITIKNIRGLQNKHINVFIKDEKEESSQRLNAPKSNRLSDQLGTIFRRQRFTTVRSAVAWLLRRLPLITPSAENVLYQQSFPFAVVSDEKYQSCSIAKQRSNEWIRAQFVIRQLKQHPFLPPKSLKLWSTKQLVQFAIRFGYTPVHSEYIRRQCTKPSKDLKQMIQSEIDRDLILNTVTLNHAVSAWIAKTENSLRIGNIHAPDDNEIITVDGDDNPMQKSRPERMDGASLNNMCILQLPENRVTECSFVNDVCRSAEIKLQSEEIADGVMHNSVELILATALRSFLDELLRRAYASGNHESTNNWRKPISLADIQRVINTNEKFDFLTNKYMGIVKSEKT